MKCSDCKLQATKSRGFMNGLGEDLGRRYDHLCESCTKTALKKLHDDTQTLLDTMKTPGFRSGFQRKMYAKYESEENIDMMIHFLIKIAGEETKLENYTLAREEIAKALKLNLDFGCSEHEASLMQRIAIIERREGNEIEAINSYKHAVAIKREIKSNPDLKKGRYHTDFPTLLKQYGNYLSSLEYYEEAEKILQEATTEWENSLKNDVDDVIEILIRHGQVLGKLNRRSEQIDAYKNAITKIEDSDRNAPSWLIEEFSNLTTFEEE